MGIPLQPVNIQAPTIPDPFLKAVQIASGLSSMVDKHKTAQAQAKQNQLKAPLMQAQTANLQARTKALPIQTQAALLRAQASPMRYTVVANPATGQNVLLDKTTGQMHVLGAEQGDIIPGTAAPVNLGAQPQQQQMPSSLQGAQAQTMPSQSLGAMGDQQFNQGIQGIQTPSGTVPMQRTLRNILSYSRYHPGGTQSIVPSQEGGLRVTSTPTTATQTAQQTGTAGEAGFQAMYPYMHQVIEQYGSSTYGQGLQNAIKTLNIDPTNEKALNSVALYLAMTRLKTSIASDIARMTKSGVPSEKITGAYMRQAFAQIPSGAPTRAALMLHPQAAARVKGLENDYFFQLESIIPEARARSMAGGSGVNLPAGSAVGGGGQPMTTHQQLSFAHPLGEALETSQAAPVKMPTFQTRDEAKKWFLSLTPEQQAQVEKGIK